MTKLTPTALWAQRSDRVLLTLDVQDCASPTIKFDNDGVTETGTLEFSGTTSDGKEYELKLIMNKAIKPEDCKAAVRPRKIEMVVMKAETEDSWWPYLTYEKKKDPHIKTDFNKWVDEDEEDEGNMDGGFDMSAMQNMSQFGGGGMGGMDLSQMMAGMGGMGGMDMGGDMGEGEDDSDDEDLPDLEPSPAGAENL